MSACNPAPIRFAAALSAALLISLNAPAIGDDRDIVQELIALGYPPPRDDELVHIPPTIADLDTADIHPQLKQVIQYGHDLFTDTQQLRGRYVFNDMSCSSCHLGDGAQSFSAPVWPAAITLPDFRGKNQHVNSLEERIAGCFSYSMNGTPPDYGSDIMLALSAYHQWLATGVPMYPGQPIYGRGFPAPSRPDKSPDYARGQAGYEEHCAICHQSDGQGVSSGGKTVFPPLWGDHSFNWGAGIARVHTAAGFIQNNMPLGQPNSLTDQEAWDIAFYMNSQERPQDPRYTGNLDEMLELFGPTFHRHSLYGQTREHDGHRLGDHTNTGEKDFLRPWPIGVQRFESREEKRDR